jgi:hypothetical protein
MKGWIMGFAVLLASPAAAQSDRPQIPSPEEAAARLRECGFERVDVKYDEGLEEDVLTLPGIKTASDEQIECAARVTVDSYYYLDLPEDLQKRYWQAYAPLEEEKSREISRKWFEDRGLLDTVPKYDPAEISDEAFAKELESFCGDDAKGALESEYGPHSISPAWADTDMSDKDVFERIGAAMVCLLRSGEAAGFTIYLVGNDKERASK